MSIQDIASLELAIHTWLTTVSGVIVIHADENAPVPNSSSGNTVNPVTPWFTYRISNIQGKGLDFIPQPTGNLGDPTLVEIDGNRDFTLEILGFSRGCYQLTSNLKDSLSRPSQLETLRTNGVIIVNSNNAIINLSGLDGTEMEERSSYDVFMRTDSVLTNEDTGRIEELIDAIGTYKNPGSTDIITTINVTSS